MKKYLLEIVVFITGAVVMILELTATRVLAPYMGGSIIVWTSLIGIILGSLALGYWQGGELADRKPSYRALSFIIFLTAGLIGVVSVVKDSVLDVAQLEFVDLRARSIVSTLILFAPPSVFLGMVLPYAVKLKLRSLKKTGRTAGNLFAFSTVGSIVGTFAAGFYLIAYLGSTKILVLVSLMLLFASFLSFFAEEARAVRVLIFALIAVGFASYFVNLPVRPLALVDVDTAYSRVLLVISEYPETPRPVLFMNSGIGQHSAMYLDIDDDLFVEYTKYFRLARHFKPEIAHALMVGGGGYSYPKDFLKRYRGAKIDVVEIDPQITELAKEYFNLSDNPRLTIYHQDGRVFLNNNKKKYDAIFIDAYKADFAMPFHLTTYEAVGKMYESLNDSGLVIVNIVSAIEGPAGKFLRAELATYKAVFPQVYLFPVADPNDAHSPQHIALVALKTSEKPAFESKDKELDFYLRHLWTREIPSGLPILTDDYSPVEQYVIDMAKQL